MQNIKPTIIYQIAPPYYWAPVVVQSSFEFEKFKKINFFIQKPFYLTEYPNTVAIFRPKVFVLRHGQVARVTSFDGKMATVKTLWNGVEESCEVSELTTICQSHLKHLHETNFNQ